MICRLLQGTLAVTSVLTLVACGEPAGDPRDQYGSDPKLPEPHQYLVPPMKVFASRGWHPGETPAVPAGLHIQAFATDFLHPRIVYPLPNGDVLVVESNGPKGPIYRLKDYIEGKVKALAGSGAPAGQRISLLRDHDGDGVPEVRT